MQNAGAMKGVMDSKNDGGGGKAQQARAFKLKQEQARDEANRKNEERSLLDKGERK